MPIFDILAVSMIEYGIKPECEIFDLAMLYAAAEMVKDGRLKAPAHVQFVFGLKNALPPKREILEFEAAPLKEVLPGATWTAAGLGRSQPELNHCALELGGHCLTGPEDNLQIGTDS